MAIQDAAVRTVCERLLDALYPANVIGQPPALPHTLEPPAAPTHARVVPGGLRRVLRLVAELRVVSASST